MTFADLRQKLKIGEVSSKELVQEKLNRIKELDTSLNAFLTINTDQALMLLLLRLFSYMK